MRNRQQQEEDCCWLLNTPALLTLGDPLPFYWGIDRLKPAAPLRADVATLQADTQLPLGVYAEQLLAGHLTGRADIAHCLNNLVVNDHGKTRGEFDFLIRPAGQRGYFHLEFAIKFYLGQPESGLWLGMNPRDRLDKKQQHMCLHQIRLGDTPAARLSLESRGIQLSGAGARMQGILFYPLGLQMAPPRGISALHQRGAWIHANRMNGQPAALKFQRLPQRLQWLAGDPLNSTKADSALISASDLASLASIKPQMALCYRYKESRWQPCERWIVVPDNWPNGD